MTNTNPTGDNVRDEHARSGRAVSRARSVLTPRRMLLFAAMLVVLLVGLLVGTTGEGPLSRWTGTLDESAETAGDDGASAQVGTTERDMVGSDGAVGDATGSGASGASGSGTVGAGSGDPAGAPDGGSGTGTTGSSGGAATDPTSPPPPSSQPPAASRAVSYLDDAFGETMFPDEYPGLRQVNVFDFDDNEVTATYKDSGAALFDLVRITVERTGSEAEAARALELVRELFPADTISYEWGGRTVVQASDVRIGTTQDPAFNFSWTQGRYAVDVTVYPPYRSGVAEGRAAALEFIGGLEY